LDETAGARAAIAHGRWQSGRRLGMRPLPRLTPVLVRPRHDPAPRRRDVRVVGVVQLATGRGRAGRTTSRRACSSGTRRRA